jgi:hypothetical protein
MSGLAMVGRSSFASHVASLVVNAVILIYCLLPGTKSSFGVQDRATPG